MTLVAHHRYPYTEYVSLEAISPIRHEFFDGEIYAMAGGTPGHAALVATVLRIIGSQLPAGCRSYTSDLRVRISASGLSTYPDGSIICGITSRAPDDSIAATNPILLFEVTNPSTENYDRGEKIDHYKLLPTVREVLIVSHAERWLVLHRRNPDGWRTLEAREGQTLDLACFGGRLSVDEVYRDGLED